MDDRRILVEALGVLVPIDVDAAGDEAADAVRRAWSGASVPTADARSTTRPVRLADGELSQAMSFLSTDVTLAALEAQRGGAWMLHAAAVALPDGSVVVFVGPSGRGKTTASRALAAEYGYVSDETAAVLPDGSVLPYRKPLSVIERADAPKRQIPPAELGLRDLPDAPLRLARIVLLDRRDDGPDLPVVRPVDLADGLRELVEETSYLASLERPLQTIEGHLRRTGGLVRVTYRESATLVPLLPELVTSHRRAGEHRQASPVRPRSPERAGTATDDSAAPRYRRAAALDELTVDDPDRVVILHPAAVAGGAMARVLAGIGPSLWRAAAGVGITELVAAAVADHGDPPGDVRALVADAVERLVAEGVLLRE